MRAVQKYISDDGREFLEEGKCIAYEALCKEVAEIMSALAPIPSLPTCSFENGAGYIQHDKESVTKVRRALLTLANTITPHKWFEQALADDSAHESWAGRMMSEMPEKCLWRAWHRISCMTGDYREYGQPYFANNPGEAKNVCLNGAA